MRKIKPLFYALLLSWLFAQPIKADSNDSCTQTSTIMNAILDITTLGLFDAYSEDFYMYGAPGTQNSSGTVTDYYGDPNACFADYYPDSSGGNPYFHNSSYCQPNGTNCCEAAIDPNNCTTNSSTGITSCLPYPSAVGVPCPSGTYTGECNPDGGLEFCYYNYNFTLFEYTCNGDSNQPVWTSSGYYAWYLYPPGQLRTVTDGDKICVQFETTLGYQNIGCKYLPSCTQFVLQQNCYVAESCYSYSSQFSLAMLPITSGIMQCINDTIQYLFYGDANCSTNNDSLNDNGTLAYVTTTFSTFQGQMRSAVRGALMLYIVLFGLKTVLSSDLPSKGEFFRMGAKFTLVLYFSTGININGVVGTDGQPYYDDGIHRYMLPLYVQGSAELADMVYSAGGSDGLCVYDTSLYPDGLSYLSMWDGIDCRLLYYFGIDLSTIVSSVDNYLTDSGSSYMSLATLGTPTLLSLLLPSLFSFQLIFLLCMIIFTIMFVSVVIYFINISIISAILIAILIYLAPVFVPMALFESTKGYYDGWLKTTTSYALQPMIIAAYIAMMFTIFDQTMFGDCVFQNYPVNFEMGSQQKSNIPFFVLCDPHDSTGNCYGCEGNTCPDYATTANVTNENITQCNQTIGYYLNPIVPNTSYTYIVDAIFFNIVMLDSNVMNDMLTGIVTLCLFGYIFYKFADVLDEFVGELTGGASLGSAAGKPMAVLNKAGSKALEYAKYATRSKKKSDEPDKSSNSKARSSSTNSTNSNAKSSSSTGSKAKSSSSDQKPK